MKTSKEQLATRSRQLVHIVDDLFVVFEEAHHLLCNWKPYYHTYFVDQLVRLQQLESELYMLGYDEEFVLAVKQAVYRYVFGE